MNAADLKFEDINIDDQFAFFHVVTIEDIERFAAVSGDYNPLHVDQEYARQSVFGQQIVHGMFLAGLISRLVGMHLPGRRCLYMSQSVDFAQPVFVGDTIEIIGRVQHKQLATNTLVLRTEIHSNQQIVVRGKAHVKVLD